MYMNINNFYVKMPHPLKSYYIGMYDYYYRKYYHHILHDNGLENQQFLFFVLAIPLKNSIKVKSIISEGGTEYYMLQVKNTPYLNNFGTIFVSDKAHVNIYFTHADFAHFCTFW